MVGDVTLDGDATTGVLGADMAGQDWLACAAVAVSKGGQERCRGSGTNGSLVGHRGGDGSSHRLRYLEATRRPRARANETMVRAVVAFVGRGRSEAQRPVTTAAAAGSGRRRLPRHLARCGNPVVTGR